jgi:hypothetical protein
MIRRSSPADFDVVSGPAPSRPRPAAEAPRPDDSAGERDPAPPAGPTRGDPDRISRQ